MESGVRHSSLCVCHALGRCSSSEELHKLLFPDNGLKGYQRLRVLGAAPPAGPGSSSTAGDDGAELRQDSEMLAAGATLNPATQVGRFYFLTGR